jgi:hypothetical protein
VPGRQRVEEPGVDQRAVMWRDRLLGRQPGNLMAEAQPAAIQHQQPGRQHLVEHRRRATGNRFHQPQFAAGACQRRSVQHGARLVAEPHGARQHSTASRAAAGTSVTPAAITTVT